MAALNNKAPTAQTNHYSPASRERFGNNTSGTTSGGVLALTNGGVGPSRHPQMFKSSKGGVPNRRSYGMDQQVQRLHDDQVVGRQNIKSARA